MVLTYKSYNKNFLYQQISVAWALERMPKIRYVKHTINMNNN